MRSLGFSTNLPLLLILIIRVGYAAFGVNHDIAEPVSLAGNGIPARSLRAAHASSNIKVRSMEGCLGHDFDLHYLDGLNHCIALSSPADQYYFAEQTHQTSSQFIASLHMSATLPTVLLEEIEHHFSEITCSDSSIYLKFATHETAELAYEEFVNVEEFFVITAHKSCNAEGERGSYRVSGLTFYGEDDLIILSTSPSRWQEIAHTLKVDFGVSDDDFELRRHVSLQPRQAAPSSTTSTASFSSSLPIPYPAPSGGTVLNVTKNIHSSWLNATILPWDVSLGPVTVTGPQTAKGFQLKCKNCTIDGSISLASGSFSMSNVNGSSNNTESIDQYIEEGFVELRVHNLAAHIEMETIIQPTTALYNYTAPFPSIPITPLLIPGIGSIGPIFTPQVKIGVKLQTELAFTYGFDITVQDNSFIQIAAGNVTNSTISGFSGSTIRALPFQAEVDDIELILTTGFVPELLAGISFLDNHGTIGVGVYLDLPSISAEVKQVAHVDAKCEPISNNSDVNGVLGDIFGSLTNIIPSVEFDFGFYEQAEVHALDETLGEFETWQAFGYQQTLSTACLSFDAHHRTFGPAANTVSVTGSGTATASGPRMTSATTSAATSIAYPSTKMGSDLWLLCAFIVCLATFSA